MDRVSAGSQFFAEFGSHDPAAAVSGIYRYADVHRNRAWSLLLVRVFGEGLSLSRGFSSSKYGRGGLAFIRPKISEAGDPRYRLPLSQLDSPSERGASEGGSIKPVWEFSNDSCNELFQTTNIRLVPVRANS